MHCARNSGRAFHWPIGTVALATLDTTSAMDRRTSPTGSLTTPSSRMFLTCSCVSRSSRGQWPRTRRFRTTAASWRTCGSGSPRACVRSAGTTLASRATLRRVASALPRTSLSAASNALRISGRCSTVAPGCALYVVCARTTRPIVREVSCACAPAVAKVRVQGHGVRRGYAPPALSRRRSNRKSEYLSAVGSSARQRVARVVGRCWC